MKKLILFSTFFLLLFSCENNTKPKEKPILIKPEVIEAFVCSNEVQFGDTAICLPEIKGITECYKHPKIKLRADEYDDTENTTLGYYLNNETYKKVDSIENVSYDDYYKIYAPNVGMNYKMTQSEMVQIMSMMTNGFLDKTLEETNEDLKISGKGVKLSQPVLIEKYAINNRSSTMVVLMRVSASQMDKLMMLSMSSVLIKERLIFIAYYLDYKDENTIKDIKNNTETYIETFLEVNKL